MDNDIGPVFNGTYQIRCSESVVDDQRQAVPMRDLSDGIDIRNVRIGIAEDLDINGFRFRQYRPLHLCQIVSIDKSRLDAIKRECMSQKIRGTSIDRFLCDNMLTALCEGLDRIGDRRGSGSNSQSGDAAFESCNTFFKDILGGVGKTAINIAGI